jgi:DNA-directed RNA polymerase subunit RPC12/RpoP
MCVQRAGEKGMRCPKCGKQSVISHVTIRWIQLKGSFLPERGYYCTACGNTFADAAPSRGEFAFRSVQVATVSDALRRLQESADLVVVRHKTGLREVLY